MRFRRRCRRERIASGGSPPRSSCASSRPAAHVPPSSTHASGRSGRPRRSRTCAASFVEQRHRERAPLDDELAADVVRYARGGSVRRARARRCRAAGRRCGTPGRPGQRVLVGDANARPLERLEQRVARAIARACGTAPSRRSARRRPRADAATRRRARRRRACCRRARCRPCRRAAPAATSVPRWSSRAVAVSVSYRPPGRASVPNVARSVRSAAPRRRSSAARPSRPTSGLASSNLKYAARARRRRSVTALLRQRAADRRASTRTRRRQNARKLATPSPSERVNGCPVCAST